MARSLSSPFLCSIPYEMLAKIFGHMIDTHIYERRNALFRGQSSGLRAPCWRELQVCRHIWFAAVDTPVLWSLISFRIPFHETDPGYNWARLCIARSKNSATTISVVVFLTSTVHVELLDDLASRTHSFELAVQAGWDGGFDHLVSVYTAMKLPLLPLLKHLVLRNYPLLSLRSFHHWLSRSLQLVSLDLHLRHHPIQISELQPMTLPNLRSVHLHGHPTDIRIVLQLLPDPHEELCIHCENDDFPFGDQTAKKEQRRLLDVVLTLWDRRIHPHMSRSQYILVIDRQYRFHPADATISVPPCRLTICSTISDPDFVCSFAQISNTICVYGGLDSPVLRSIDVISNNVRSDWALSAVFFAPWSSFWARPSNLTIVEYLLRRMRDAGIPLHALMINSIRLGDETMEVTRWTQERLIHEVRMGVTFSHDV